MIKFEYNMLVLNNAFSKEDVHEIGAYADYVRSQERERIILLAERKVCFDNRDNGGCDHSGCYGMIDLIALIKGDTKT